MAHLYVLLLKMFAVLSSTHSSAWRRYQEVSFKRGELDRAVERHQSSSNSSLLGPGYICKVSEVATAEAD